MNCFLINGWFMLSNGVDRWQWVNDDELLVNDRVWMVNGWWMIHGWSAAAQAAGRARDDTSDQPRNHWWVNKNHFGMMGEIAGLGKVDGSPSKWYEMHCNQLMLWAFVKRLDQGGYSFPNRRWYVAMAPRLWRKNMLFFPEPLCEVYLSIFLVHAHQPKCTY